MQLAYRAFMFCAPDGLYIEHIEEIVEMVQILNADFPEEK